MNETSKYFGPPLSENQTSLEHETCLYLAYRSPPDPDKDLAYQLTKAWWHVFAARLAFVAVFEVGYSYVSVTRTVVPKHNLDDQNIFMDFKSCKL